MIVFSYGVDLAPLEATKQPKKGGSYRQSETEKWQRR
jgi:hypothetical protein